MKSVSSRSFFSSYKKTLKYYCPNAPSKATETTSFPVDWGLGESGDTTSQHKQEMSNEQAIKSFTSCRLTVKP